MSYFLLKIFPVISFLGTAVAIISEGQQLNLAQVFVAFVFVVSIFNLNVFRFQFADLRPLLWFLLATLPGTLLFLMREQSLTIPIAQYFGLIITWVTVLNIFVHYKYSPKIIFDIYLRCATIAAVVALIQQFAYFLDIEILYDLRWLLIGAADLDYAGPYLRTASLFTEPSYFAVFLVPAFYLSILRLTGKSKLLLVRSSLLYIFSLLSSFSAIGYVGVFLCVVFSLRFTLRNSLIALLMLSTLVFMVVSNEALSSRLSAIPSALKFNFQGDENQSAFINGLNLEITSRMIESRPIWGQGFGAYRWYSIEYLNDILSGNQVLLDRVNTIADQLTLSDGGSMYLRLFSEMGFGGVFIMIWFAINRFSWPNSPEERNLAFAAFLFLVVFSIRSGQLFRFDFIYFSVLLATLCFRGRIFAKNYLKIE